MNDNKLLLLDLGGRLQYGVKMYVDGTFNHEGKARTLTDIFSDRGLGFDNNGAFYGWNSFVMKPYLRPMSNMTYKEKSGFLKYFELENVSDGVAIFKADDPIAKIHLDFQYIADMIDWLNKHHFDYWGLIEKGLALEAPEGMYKF